MGNINCTPIKVCFPCWDTYSSGIMTSAERKKTQSENIIQENSWNGNSTENKSKSDNNNNNNDDNDNAENNPTVSEANVLIPHDDVCLKDDSQSQNIAESCVRVSEIELLEQTNSLSHSDTSDTKLDLGLYLNLLQEFLKKFDDVTEFTGTEEEYLLLLKLVAMKRRKPGQTTKECYKEILEGSHRLVKLCHKQGFAPQTLESGPLDPIFGVLLQPTIDEDILQGSSWNQNAVESRSKSDNNRNNDDNNNNDASENAGNNPTVSEPVIQAVSEPDVEASVVICQDGVCVEVDSEAQNVAEYCIGLLQVKFLGQTNSLSRSDTSDTKDVLNLGLYLKLLQKFLKKFDNVTEFTGTEEEYLRILKCASLKRRKCGETTKECYKRILADSHRFVKIYHKRGCSSYPLETEEFWGTRQQMLAGKVISDWIDPKSGPLDPIFGVLLSPSAGRAGSGDSWLFHNLVFDDMGYFAHHSAVHDAFGYLINNHEVGPGYDYIEDSWFDEHSPLVGQLSGVHFWKKVIEDVTAKHIVLRFFEL